MRALAGMPRRIVLASLLLSVVAVVEQITLVLRWLIGRKKGAPLVLDLGDDWRSIGSLLWASLGPLLLGGLIGTLSEATSVLRSAVTASQAAALSGDPDGGQDAPQAPQDAPLPPEQE